MASVKRCNHGRKKGLWRARVTRVSRDGRRRSREAYRKTRAQAYAELPRLLELISVEKTPTRQRFATFASRWFKRAGRERKSSTMHGYASILTNHLIPALGGYWLDDLRPADVSAYLDSKLASGAVGPSTARNHLRLLRKMAGDAVVDGLIDLPFTGSVPAPRTRPTHTDEFPNLLTAAQLGRVLEHIDARWRAVTIVSVFTGLRWSEVSALRWDDLDRERSELRVWRAQVRGVLDTTKTPASARRVPVAPAVLEALDQHRRELVAQQHRSLSTGWIFASSSGNLYRSWPLTKPVQRACVAAGLTDVKITAHGLRRTFADLARRVTDRTIVKAICGHVTDAMHEHYTRPDAAERAEAVRKVVALVTRDGD